MDFKVEYSNEVDEKEWNSKLLESKSSTAYQLSYWPKIYHHLYNSKPFFIKVTNSNGEIVGQLAAILHQKMFWNDSNLISRTIGMKLNIPSLLYWFYAPIVYDQSHQDEIISEILSAVDTIAVENNISMIKGISPPLMNKLPDMILKKHGYKIKPWSTYIVDLQQDENTVYASLNKKTKYDIRKSENQDFEFVIVEDRDSLNKFKELKYAWKKKIGERTSIRVPFFETHWELLYKGGYEKMFLVNHRGKTEGGIFCLIYNGNIVQHGVVNSPTANPLGGSYLTWNVLKWGIKKNFLTFDFGGANPSPDSKKETQIDFYKSKWGGKKYDYFQCIKITNPAVVKLSLALKHPRRAYKKLFEYFID